MPFEDIDDDMWQSDLELKVWASIRFSRLAIPHLRQVGGGRIINVTNIGSKTPGASSMPTAASRAAGNAITKALSKDLGKDNITVNSICIGLIKSGQMERRYERLRGDDPNLTLEDVWARGARNQSIPVGACGRAGGSRRRDCVHGVGTLELREWGGVEPGWRGVACALRAQGLLDQGFYSPGVLIRSGPQITSGESSDERTRGRVQAAAEDIAWAGAQQCKPAGASSHDPASVGAFGPGFLPVHG